MDVTVLTTGSSLTMQDAFRYVDDTPPPTGSIISTRLDLLGEEDDVHALALDGTKTVLVSEPQLKTAPAASADGLRIAYLVDRRFLRVMDPDGSNGQPVTTYPQFTYVQHLSGSPDGAYIAADIVGLGMEIVEVATG